MAPESPDNRGLAEPSRKCARDSLPDSQYASAIRTKEGPIACFSIPWQLRQPSLSTGLRSQAEKPGSTDRKSSIIRGPLQAKRPVGRLRSRPPSAPPTRDVSGPEAALNAPHPSDPLFGKTKFTIAPWTGQGRDLMSGPLLLPEIAPSSGDSSTKSFLPQQSGTDPWECRGWFVRGSTDKERFAQ